MGGLRNCRDLVLTILGARKSKMRVPHNAVGSLFHVEDFVLFLCGRWNKELSGVSFIRILIPFMRDLPS